MRLLPAALVALLVLSACDATDTRPTPPFDVETLRFDADLLVGTWDLAWAGGGWGGWEGPATPPTRTLVVREDSTYAYLIGGAVEREGRWTYEPRQECQDPPQAAGCRGTLDLAGHYEGDWRGVSEEWLVFDARPMDGGLFAYRRR